MTTSYELDFSLPYTHLRIIACRLSPTATPEILEICRTEVVVDDERIVIDRPRTLHVASSADETSAGLRTVTPKLLAQTIWTPGPPHALVTFNGSLWDIFPPPFTRGIGRIHLSGIAQLAFYPLEVHGLGELIEQLGLTAGLDHIPSVPPETRLQREVRQTTLLVIYLLVQKGDLLIESRNRLLGTEPMWHDAVLGPLAPDRGIQAMLDLSAMPLGSATPIPDVNESDPAWAVLSTDALVELATSAGALPERRRKAGAELKRRINREEDRHAPATILRRTGPLLRT